MDFLFLIVSSVMILVCFYFIISPFFVPKGKQEDVKKEGEEYLTLEAIYSAVNELEMDYLMKKMTEEDFLRLKEQYQRLAVDIMEKESKNQEKILIKKSDKEVEQEILAQLQRIRARKGR